MANSITTSTLNQVEADEDILTYTISDEALEAAASIETGNPTTLLYLTRLCYPYAFC